MPKKKKEDLTEDVLFTIKLPRGLRDSFNKTCRNMDLTASQEMRSYMRRYIAKYGQASLL